MGDSGDLAGRAERAVRAALADRAPVAAVARYSAGAVPAAEAGALVVPTVTTRVSVISCDDLSWPHPTSIATIAAETTIIVRFIC